MDNINIWHDVCSALQFMDKLSIILSCHFFKDNIQITRLYNISCDIVEKLNNNILANKIFQHINKITLVSNINVTDLDFAGNLRCLFINGVSLIKQTTIQNLNLTKFGLNNNDYIYDISFMTSLKKLYLVRNSRISEGDLRNLRLTKLSLRDNNVITNVSFMTSLKKLDISRSWHYLYLSSQGKLFKNSGLRGLDLHELDASHNPYITDISFLTSLKYLKATGKSGITQTSIQQLNLYFLDASDNKNITNVRFMTNLKILYANGDCGIGPAGIAGLNLLEFHKKNNIFFNK